VKKKSEKKPTAKKPTATALIAALETDVLEAAYPPSALDEELKQRGFDSDALAASGRAFAHELLEKRRQAWRGPARAELAKVRDKLAGVAPIMESERGPLLARLAKAKSDPRLEKLAASFRGKSLEEATIEELQDLCAEVEKLRALLDEPGSDKR
jgi:hypothetical protein